MRCCDELMLLRTRRHFFEECALGLGKMALASLFLGPRAFAGQDVKLPNPLAPKKPHFPPRARSVIYLFMAGGPSQLELFDYKPKLQELDGQPIPQSFIQGKRFAFMDSRPSSGCANRRQALGASANFAWILQDATMLFTC